MKTTLLYSGLCGFLPESDRCEWDNDGLSVLPYPEHETKKILLALDVTNDACEYAEKHGFDTIITHHPLNFRPFTSLGTGTPADIKAARLVRCSIAAMAFHTRLDRAEGGVNSIMAATLGLCEPIRFGPEGEEIGLTGRIIPRGFDTFCLDIAHIYGNKHFFAVDAGKKVSKVALCGGAAGDMITPALHAGADALVCGELKYHETLDALDSGLSVVCAGHYETEFPALSYFEKVLPALGEFETEIYKK